jgi:hypothetical protein
VSKVALLALLAASAGLAADLCPPSGSRESGSVSGVLGWTSYRGEVRGKNCVGNEIRNVSGGPLKVSWPEAGIADAEIADLLEVSVCCFDAEESRKTRLGYAGKQLEALTHIPAEEGLDKHEEGYPDLMEEDARVRTVSIRGTLRAGGESIRVDLLLKCSASKFAKQFAYQFSITDRSPDPVDVDWNLLRELRAAMSPAMQPIPNGKTYIFLSGLTPREAESTVELKTKTGQVAGRIRFDGFTATVAH